MRGSSLLTTIVLIAGWWLCQPVLLYAFSWLTGDAVFVPRYLQLALPGAALASTAMAALFIPAGEWRRISAVFALGVFLFLGQWREALAEAPQLRLARGRARRQPTRSRRGDPRDLPQSVH